VVLANSTHSDAKELDDILKQRFPGYTQHTDDSSGVVFYIHTK
jgi:hypothetical protein